MPKRACPKESKLVRANKATPPRPEKSTRIDDAGTSGTRTMTNVLIERSDQSV
jgi:hypothetical protein